MMGLGEPQLHGKYEVAGFIYYGNMREFVFKRQIRFIEPLWGVRSNVQTSSIARWKVRSQLPIRNN